RRRRQRDAARTPGRGHRRRVPPCRRGPRAGDGDRHSRRRRDGGPPAAAMGHAGASPARAAAGLRRLGAEAPRGVQVRRWLAMVLLAPVLAAQAGEAPGRHLAVISGIGGEEFYDEQFERWAGTLVDAATNDFAFEPGNVHRLGGEAAPADREAIRDLME